MTGDLHAFLEYYNVHCTDPSSYLLRVESRSDTMVLESATMWVCVSHSYKYNCGAAPSVAHTQPGQTAAASGAAYSRRGG